MTTKPPFAQKLTATPEELAVFVARLRELSSTLGHQGQSLEVLGAWGVLGHAYRQAAIDRYNRSERSKQTGPLSVWDPQLYPPGFDVVDFRARLDAFQAQRATDTLRPKVPTDPATDRAARLMSLAEGLTEAQLVSIEAQGGFAAVLAQHAEVFQQTQAHLAREQALGGEVQGVLRQAAASSAATRPRLRR